MRLLFFSVTIGFFLFLPTYLILNICYDRAIKKIHIFPHHSRFCLASAGHDSRFCHFRGKFLWSRCCKGTRIRVVVVRTVATVLVCFDDGCLYHQENVPERKDDGWSFPPGIHPDDRWCSADKVRRGGGSYSHPGGRILF